jgi:hypothetical protein
MGLPQPAGAKSLFASPGGEPFSSEKEVLAF